MIIVSKLFNKLILNEFFFGLIIFVSTCLKLYRTIFYLKVMLEVLPLYNGYKLPTSLIYFITRPISRFYEKCFPHMHMPITYMDPTIFITVEIFAVLIDFVDDIKDAFAEIIFV